MNPNYNRTITLYHQADGAWTRTVYENCSWKAGIAVTQSGTNASQSNTYTVRIPLEEAGPGFTVTTGDLVLLGEHLQEIGTEKGSRSAEILAAAKPNAFKVSAFSDNTGHLADKHYRLGG